MFFLRIALARSRSAPATIKFSATPGPSARVPLRGLDLSKESCNRNGTSFSSRSWQARSTSKASWNTPSQASPGFIQSSSSPPGASMIGALPSTTAGIADPDHRSWATESLAHLCPVSGCRTSSFRFRLAISLRSTSCASSVRSPGRAANPSSSPSDIARYSSTSLCHCPCVSSSSLIAREYHPPRNFPPHLYVVHLAPILT